MRSALLDPSLKRITIEQKFIDVVTNTSSDRYITDSQLHPHNMAVWISASACIYTCRVPLVSKVTRMQLDAMFPGEDGAQFIEILLKGNVAASMHVTLCPGLIGPASNMPEDKKELRTRRTEHGQLFAW